MKKYTLEYVKENIDKRFYKLRDPGEVYKIQKELKGLHNQNRIVIDYFKSNYYLENNRYDEYWKSFKPLQNDVEKQRAFQEKIFWEVTEKYRELDNEIRTLKPEELTFNHLEPYIKYLAHHLDGVLSAYTYEYRKDTPYFSRFGICRLINGLEEDKVEHVLDNIHEVNKLMREHHIFNEQRGLHWNTFLGVSWILIEGGLAEVSLYIANTMINLLHIPMGRFSCAINKVFHTIEKSNYVRNWSTVTWIQVIALLQLDRKGEAIAALKRLIGIYETAPYKQPYVLTNRIVEASVLLNKLEPAEEHKILAKKLFIDNSSKFLNDHTESTRERGLVIYDFCKYVLNKDI